MNQEAMRRDFENREAMLDYLREEFPQCVARDGHVSEEFIGGREAAEARLALIEAGRIYQRTRNHIDGKVSRLSPYIRYGVLNLAEVRDEALRREKRSDAYKFINELAWRDYWQRKYVELGDDIWVDQEAYKTGFTADDYADDLPDDIEAGETGVHLVDEMVKKLRTTGYIHNHERMWFASYVVHFRRVKWQSGALFFLTHLLDGDPPANNLSWQWVASTFSWKAYIFNLGNVRKYTGDLYKGSDEEIEAMGMDVFKGTYAQIAERLFPNQKRKKKADES